LDCAAFVGNFA
jgi:hypothetical protein